MNISQVTTATHVATFRLAPNTKKAWLSMDWATTDKDLLKDPAGRVYLLVVDGVIMKVGGSADAGGIRRTLTTYASGNTGRPSIRTYGIALLIRNALEAGSVVEAHLIPSERVVAPVKGLFGKTEGLVASFKEMEQKCLSDFVATDGQLPEWNFQEAGRPWDRHIQEAHAATLR